MDYWQAPHRYGILPDLEYSDQHRAVTGRASAETVPAHGIAATINTDDPAVEGIELPMNTMLLPRQPV